MAQCPCAVQPPTPTIYYSGILIFLPLNSISAAAATWKPVSLEQSSSEPDHNGLARQRTETTTIEDDNLLAMCPVYAILYAIMHPINQNAEFA